jgi:uncharacterized protein YkwD
MAALIRGDSQQRRESLVWDERLHRVAQKRAADLGRRAYFAHVDPDGLGPNHHLTQAGYRLPIKWTAFKSSNQVESILAGDIDPDKACERWLKSGKHRRQLLGLNGFFQAQTRFGVAHARIPGSPFTDYWVYIGAPPES